MNDNSRIDRILQGVLELASGNLDARVDPVGFDDPLDGVAEGINMLAEELSASVTALQRSENCFRTLIERSPDAIVVHRDGRFIYVNQSLLSLLDYPDKTDLIGKRVKPLFGFDDDKDAAHRLAAIPGLGSPPATREGRLVGRDGKTLHVEVASIPIVFNGNSAVLTTVRDVSARRQLTAKMMELDRMIAVGTLAAGVGHEINNPLAYIIWNLDYALKQLESQSGSHDDSPGPATDLGELFDALSDARNGAERVRDIVTDLKTFSRSHNRIEEKLELGPVLESAINMAFNEIRHRAKLVRDFEEKSIITGNPSRLGQVFLNLLVNAAHSIPEGTTEVHRILVRTKTVANEVQIEFIDTGKGIKSKHIPRLFDPFFTTKPIGQGTGLGLYICQRIVQEHGGDIEVESERGKGSTFRVLLPRCSEKNSETVCQSTHAATIGKSKKACILIVDDEPDVGRSLVRLLGHAHEVTAVTTAKQALMQFLDGEYYDVVLCDLMMPEMTGMELYRKVEQRTPHMAEKMIFYTGGAFTPASRAFAEQMQNRCLEKPLDMKRVQKIIHERVKAREGNKGEGNSGDRAANILKP